MAIEIENITKKFGRQAALKNINLIFESGRVTGLIGPNGAGKTTLMRIICGLLTPDEGMVRINNTRVTPDSAGIRKTIGYLPENNPLYPEMYIKEYLGFVASIYNGGKDRIQWVAELTGLGTEIHKKIGQLSKGYRQRVGLAQALIHDPDILILDEPTTGLDPNQIVEIRNLISSVSKEKTVILSTHIMQEVEAICDRVIIMNKAEVVADNETKELQSQTGEATQTIIVEFDRNVDEEMLCAIDGIDRVKKIPPFGWLVQCSGNTDVRPSIFNFAVKNRLTVLSLQKRDKKLEDVFHDLTSN